MKKIWVKSEERKKKEKRIKKVGYRKRKERIRKIEGYE